MKYNIKINLIILFFGIVAVAFTGCEKEDFLGNPDRLFRPQINETIVSGTWVTLKWDKYKGTSYFEIDLSVDSFKNTIRSLHTDSNRITIQNLEFDTQYQVRIRSVGDSIISSGDSIRSEYLMYNIATHDYPTLLSNPTSADIIDKSIRVKWDLSALEYSRIDVLVNKDSLYKSVTLSEADNNTGEKIISGLRPQTTYYIKIYAGNDYKGKRIVKTVSSQVFEGDVVDLRDLTDEESLNKLTQLYVDSLALVYPGGFNLVLSGGTSYAIPTINVPVSMNIVTGLSFKGNANIVVNGGFGAIGDATIDKLRFEKLNFGEGNIAGKLKTDGNYGGTYLINMNQANGNFTNIDIQNCTIKYKRGNVRIQTTASIGLLTINNCVFDSIGGYGIINLDNAASSVKDIVIKNSTFSHFDGYLCRNTKSTAAPELNNSITIENITTCYAPSSGKYFLELTGQTYPGGINIENSIFGSVFAPGITVNGLRSSCTNVSVSDCFKTSDLAWTINTSTLEPSYPIESTDLGKTSDEIFADPSRCNFKVTNTALVNKAGDPRWW